jgi:glycosyltransferase involved in cell wall biosynthesis
MSSLRISVLLLAYQQAGTAAEAARSVLEQAGEPVEVILSDDASSDGTGAALEAVATSYHGPHRVVVRRNPHNLGIGGHYNALVAEARGELLVTAAGDDRSLPGRIARIAAAWDASGQQLDLIASPLVAMSAAGELRDRIKVDRLQDWQGLNDWARRRPRVVGAAHAFTRRLFDRFGPFGPGIAYEDQILTFRALAAGGALTLDEPLVAYRQGGTSERGRALDAAGYLDWMRQQNDRHRAEASQLLADARRAGAEALVRAALHTDLARQGFLARSLDAARPGADVGAWAALFSEPQLPFGWRLRKWLGHRAPGLAAALRRRQEARSG